MPMTITEIARIGKPESCAAPRPEWASLGTIIIIITKITWTIPTSHPPEGRTSANRFRRRPAPPRLSPRFPPGQTAGRAIIASPETTANTSSSWTKRRCCARRRGAQVAHRHQRAPGRGASRREASFKNYETSFAHFAELISLALKGKVMIWMSCFSFLCSCKMCKN